MPESLSYSRVTTVRTLGPPGTNLEAASRWWCSSHGLKARVLLHPTLEDAVREMPLDGTQVLIACIVYPELHTLVFENLERLEIVECFVVPTHRMVLASRDGTTPTTVATHPAPQTLVRDVRVRKLVNSNSAAALECAQGQVEGCVTTSVAAAEHGLKIVRDFGSLPMGFSVHAPRATNR